MRRRHAGQTWGTGVCLLWPDGKALRVNLRGPDGRFGIDSTAGPQQIAGDLVPDGVVTLRLRLETDKAVVEAHNADAHWRTLGSFPRAKFPGAPDRLRVGKMHAVEGVDDHSDPDSEGTILIPLLRVYGQ